MNMLDHIPEHQRDAIHFINMKIAHLEAQIKALKQAKAVLGAELEEVEPFVRAAITSPVIEPEKKPSATAYKSRGFGSIKKQVMTSLTPTQVYAALHAHSQKTFCNIDGGQNARWRLREEAAAA
jgi:hypothetical protein